MAAKIISQKKWSKLVAATGALSQPAGALPRLSNLQFTQRGSLQICPGSALIATISTVFTNNRNLISFSSLNSNTPPVYSALSQNPTPVLTNVTGFTVTFLAGSGNPAGQYYFGIVAMLGTGHSDIGPTLHQSVAATAVGGASFTWTVTDGALGYQIYLQNGRPPNPGNNGALIATIISSATSFTYAGVFPSGSVPLPFGNTGSLLELFLSTLNSPDLTFNFITAGGSWASVLPVAAAQLPGSTSFNYLTPIPGFSPYGGLPGAACPIPQQIQFAGQIIAILGNGQAPKAYTPAAEGESVVSPLINTFQAAYPTWQASVDWTSGSQLTASDGSVAYVFTATQGGVSGSGSAPSWNFTKDAETSDGSVIWTSGGPITSGIPPIGAAHAVAYAGSLWLANTWPISTQYPSWAANTAYANNTQIVVQDGNTPAQSWLFLSLSSGVSGGTAPTWVFTPGSSTIGDGTMAWLCESQASYPSWVASTAYVVGAQVTATDPYGNYWLFTATIAGASGSTAPSWNFAVGVNTIDNTVTWVGEGEITTALATGGAVAGIDGPSCLKMSDANNPNSWNPVNVAFVSKSDGTQITGLQPFTIAALGISPTGSLCVFKEFTTYQVIGVFGSTSFEIQPAQTNMGCIAARSIQFLPGFGVSRYSHLGFAVFDGINDRLISEDIRPYLFGGVDSEADLVPVDPSYLYLSQSAQTVSPPMYFCAMPLIGQAGQLTRLFCYDLVMKSWAVLDLPWAITSLGAMSGGEGYPLVLAGRADGTVQRMQSGDISWSQGGTDQSDIAWSFRTPDLFGEGGTQRMFYEQATITGYGSAAMVQSIIARLWLDGQQLGAQAVDVVPQGGSNLFEARVRIFRSGYRAHLDVAGSGAGATGVIDGVDWAVSPKSAMARRIIG